jgi:DNA-binding SARP family transcriptional activator
MLRVCTFGGLTLQEDGVTITGAATHRRELALLALLAVAGDAGMSREKILAYLWPDSDTRHARHALNQLLYLQRRNNDDASPFAGRKTLRMTSDLVESDVQVFEAALADGRLEEAVGLYSGPFLDGFFLDGAPTFEDWIAGCRERFASEYVRTLQELACRSASTGDRDAALEWRRQAVGTDPLNGHLVAAYVEALLDCDNLAGALKALEAHRDRLQSEVGLGLEPRLQALDAAIRARCLPGLA